MTSDRDFDGATTQHAPLEAPKTSVASWLQPGAPLKIGEILGEGGMGVVRSAMQPSLQRVVAVKSPKAGASRDDATLILREAWVTGFLEHPNIVPVHEIAIGENGEPQVVMRRIQGLTWHDCLRDPQWAATAGARDLLEQNLRTFVNVCHAVEFAHQKGVMHRDIKPANVMLGSFGEVYLLDWGIALALFGPATRLLPLASEAREPAGTVSYIAPEMAGVIDAPLSERTDIYLLGAVLFEIATGKPPHGDTLSAALASLSSDPPSFVQVSSALAVICGRAMQHDPAARYANVAELRSDVQRFLTHRDSLVVAGEASALLARLREAIAANEARRVIYDLCGECRFAFREALRTWPDNDVAKRGLREAATIVAEHELVHDPRVASALLDEMPDAPPSLSARVKDAVATDERQRAGNAHIASALDAGVGSRGRNALLLAFGLLWIVSSIFGDRIGPWTHVRFFVGSALPLPILGVVWLVSRELRRTLFNRRMMASLALLLVVQAGLFAICYALGISVAAARTLQLGAGFIVSSMAAIAIDRRVWPMSLALGITVAACSAFPQWRPVLTAIAYSCVTINFLFVWKAHERTQSTL